MNYRGVALVVLCSVFCAEPCCAAYLKDAIPTLSDEDRMFARMGSQWQRPTNISAIEVSEKSAAPKSHEMTVCPAESRDAGCNYRKLCDALRDAKDGDTIIVRPGVYTEGCAIAGNHITLLAQAGAHLTGVAYGGKANLVVEGNDVVIDGLECSKAYAEGNGACIRIEGRNVTLRHLHIHDEQMGILSGGSNGRIVIEDSLIENIGAPNSDLSHCIYIAGNSRGVADEVIIQRNVIRRSMFAGHLIKSRALKTVIEGNVLASLDARNSREIDIPQGGVAIIQRNVIEKGPASDNDDLIGLALEPKNGIHKDNYTFIANNWIILDRSAGRLLTNHSPGPVIVAHNKFVGLNRRDDTAGGESFGGQLDWYDNRVYTTRCEAGLGPYPTLPRARR